MPPVRGSLIAALSNPHASSFASASYIPSLDTSWNGRRGLGCWDAGRTGHRGRGASRKAWYILY